MSAVYAAMDALLPFEWLHYTFMKNAMLALLLIALMIFRPSGIFGRWEFSLTRLLGRFFPSLLGEPKK